MSVITALNTFTQLAPCRVVATSNQAGTFFAPSSSGVGTTLTYTAAAALTIDSVALSVNDRVLLQNQTSAFQNGIYVVINAGSASTSAVLQRAGDFQSIEQMKTGQFVPIGAGTVNAGFMFTLVEPLPTTINVSSIVFIKV